VKPIHYFLLAGGVFVPVALWFAGHEGAAGFVLLLTFVGEVIFSVTTGKKGNDTQR